MGLPTSRDITLGPDTPFPSPLGNALQDQIIGWKHPLLTIPIAASEWMAEAASVTYSVANGKWTWTGFDDITVGLRIPIGTRIVGAKFNYSRAGGTLHFFIDKRAANAGAWTNIVNGSDAATAGINSITLNCAEIVAADTQYRLRVDAAVNPSTFDVASYFIDRL